MFKKLVMVTLTSIMIASCNKVAKSEEVDVELIVSVDISQSMDDDEQKLQRDAYVSAINSFDFINATQQGINRKIAMMYVEWGGVNEQFIIVPWMIVNDKESAKTFTDMIKQSPFRKVQRTSIAGLMQKVPGYFDNMYESERLVIDISGDGPNNQGGSVTDMREMLVNQGITINGLPLMMKSNKNTWQAMLNLDHYYEDCVIGGPGSFAIPVKSLKDFSEAVLMKLRRDIGSTVPHYAPVKYASIFNFSGREKINCGLFD